MTKKEFEDRIGREATMEEYEYANVMYMSAGNVDKDTLCAEYKKLMQSKSARAIFEFTQSCSSESVSTFSAR